MTVFVGRRLCDEKYEGGPACELSWPSEPKTPPVVPEADWELSCEKLRAHVVAKAAASGVREVARDLEFLSKLEPVEAISRVRAAIVRVGASGDDGACSSKDVPPASANSCVKHRPLT